MEETSDETEKKWLRLFPKMKYCRFIFIALIACVAAYGYAAYEASLFERRLGFSQLSRLQREMALHGEAGFYYTYFKTVVEERQFLAAINKLMYDRTVEYPNEVNAFHRFDIIPEVILGALYRGLRPWLGRACGPAAAGGPEAVQVCSGLGEPVLFYLQAVWAFTGLSAAAVFVCGTVLSDTILGGLASLAWFLRLHPHCARAAVAPAERAALAQPALLAHGALLAAQLRAARRGQPALTLQVAIFLVNSYCLVSWQFARFVFLAQTALFFLMEQLRVVDVNTLWFFLHTNFCGLHMAVLLLQGNDALKASLYASSFVVVSAYCLLFSGFRIKVQTRSDLFLESWLVLLRIAIVVCATFWLQSVIVEFLNVEEDSHIWDLLYAKLDSDYETFHTMIFTCSAVFDFLPLETWKELLLSGLIPVALVATFNAVSYWYRTARKSSLRPPDERKEDAKKAKTGEESNTESDEDSGIENVSESKMAEENKMAAANLNAIEDKLGKRVKLPVQREKDSLIEFLRNLDIDAAVFYNVSLMVVFGVMAGLAMRLKLLFVPQMCLVSSLIMDIKQFPASPRLLCARRVLLPALLLPALLLWAAAGAGGAARAEAAHGGKFSDPPLEELLSWAAAGGARAVYAAPAALAAALRLAAGRAVALHPHLHHRRARERARAAQQAYGGGAAAGRRRAAAGLRRALAALRVSHLVLDKACCRAHPSDGCSCERLWDGPWDGPRDGPGDGPGDGPRLCHELLQRRSEHFYALFDNSRYTVFQLTDYSVRYMPRLLDS